MLIHVIGILISSGLILIFVECSFDFKCGRFNGVRLCVYVGSWLDFVELMGRR